MAIDREKFERTSAAAESAGLDVKPIQERMVDKTHKDALVENEIVDWTDKAAQAAAEWLAGEPEWNNHLGINLPAKHDTFSNQDAVKSLADKLGAEKDDLTDDEKQARPYPYKFTSPFGTFYVQILNRETFNESEESDIIPHLVLSVSDLVEL